MFLELCGKFFFSRLHPAFFYSLLLFPIFLICVHFFTQHSDLQQLETRFASAARHGKTALARKLRAEEFISQHAHADPYFLDRQIESLSFLERERTQIESLLNHPALFQKKELEERLRYLSGEKNRLTFSEENIRSSKTIKETEEKQRHPVQIDEEDLARLCSLIENVPVASFTPVPKMPQLLFLDFRIKPEQTSLNSKVYELQTQLLKREWISP